MFINVHANELPRNETLKAIIRSDGQQQDDETLVDIMGQTMEATSPANQWKMIDGLKSEPF